jgi:hypothetical protein
MKFEIKRAKNGWILKSEDDGDVNTIVAQDDYADEVECFAAFLRTLSDEFGPMTSRYSPKRIYVRVEPGDKCADFEEPVSLDQIAEKMKKKTFIPIRGRG